MKKYLEELLAALNFAWGELFDFPAQLIFKNQPRCDEKNVFILASFPLLGVLVGVLTALLGTLVASVFNKHAAGVVFAVVAWIILSFKDSGRGDGWLGNFFYDKLRDHENAEFIRNVLTICPVLIKFAILLFVGLTGKYCFFAVQLGGAFALQAALISSEDSHVQFVPSNPRALTVFRVTLVVLALIAFIFCRVGTIGAIAAGTILYMICNRKLTGDGFTAASVSRAGYIAEWVLLGVGLLLL